MAPTKDTLFSSPDPLSMSSGNIADHSQTEKGLRPSITPRKVLNDVSGNAQIQEFYINTPPNPTRNASPKKSPKRRTQSASPWRIRLTVQAEPVDEIQRSKNSPVKRLTEQTTTITVPLKGGDDTPLAVKKGRGRPRKSLDSPVKRSGTPKPKAGARRRTMPLSPKKQEVDAPGEMATPLKKPRGRPKKSTEPKDGEPSLGLSQKNDTDLWLGSSLVDGEEKAETRSKTARTRSRGRRQEITPIKIAVDSDVESQYSSAGVAGDGPKELAWSLGNRHDEGDQVDEKLSTSYEAQTPHTEQSSFLESSHGQSTLGHQDENEWRSMICHDALSLDPHRHDVQEPIESDPTVQHQEYDSILESEGFSMVSVSSLPSVGNNSVSPPQHYGSLRDHTPAIASSPSAVPPAPDVAKTHSSPRQLEVLSDGTPKLARVVRAGIALQGVLSPKERSQKLGSPFQGSQKVSPILNGEKPVSQREFSRRVLEDRSPKELPDDLFRGFGEGTRRELKAGLRLGEELAKRQQQSSQNFVVHSKGENDVFRQTSSLNYPQLPSSVSKEVYSLKSLGSEKQVRYPLISNNQLPSPERSLVDEEENRMSWKADTPIKQEVPEFTSAQLLVSDESIGPNASAIDYTLMARQEEWQREREAVSKQIEMANKSQVIIIDSDDEEDEEKEEPEEDVADSDIWQAEAQSTDRSRETTPETSNILLQPEVLKPRRSKLPSPWRRNSQVIYSDEVEPTESDLFWQPDQSQARASKRQNAKKGQVQDRSDISAECVLDISLDNARKADAQIQRETSKAWPFEGSVLSNDGHSQPATSAQHTLHDSSMQHADHATKSPVVVMSSEDCAMPELPPTQEASAKDITGISKKIASLKVTETASVKPSSSSSEDSKAVIDPRLFQKKIRPSSASNKPIHPIPIQPLQLTQSSTSWLSRLTAPIWSVFAPAASLPPAATKEDILGSSPYEPLCQLTPWEECHFRALGPLYYGSLLYGAHLFPFNPDSPSAPYCGAYVTTKSGWSRKITPADCGITDAFMVLLDERGFALGEPGARWIDEGMVITMCVALWMGMVKRGEIVADRSKGERIGLRDQGDKKWTKDDIDWRDNQSAYFERKRREFDGLPSWKNKA